MEIVERIMELVVLKAKSKREFSSMIDIEQTLFNNYMIGKREGMNFDIVDSILRTFPEVSAEWLLRGEGSMFIEQASPASNVIPAGMGGVYDTIIKERDELIEDLKAELNQMKGENRILREQMGLGERRASGKSA